jgi:hypothetical protein
MSCSTENDFKVFDDCGRFFNQLSSKLENFEAPTHQNLDTSYQKIHTEAEQLFEQTVKVNFIFCRSFFGIDNLKVARQTFLGKNSCNSFQLKVSANALPNLRFYCDTRFNSVQALGNALTRLVHVGKNRHNYKSTGHVNTFRMHERKRESNIVQNFKQISFSLLFH